MHINSAVQSENYPTQNKHKYNSAVTCALHALLAYPLVPCRSWGERVVGKVCGESNQFYKCTFIFWVCFWGDDIDVH